MGTQIEALVDLLDPEVLVVHEVQMTTVVDHVRQPVYLGRTDRGDVARIDDLPAGPVRAGINRERADGAVLASPGRATIGGVDEMRVVVVLTGCGQVGDRPAEEQRSVWADAELRVVSEVRVVVGVDLLGPGDGAVE